MQWGSEKVSCALFFLCIQLKCLQLWWAVLNVSILRHVSKRRVNLRCKGISFLCKKKWLLKEVLQHMVEILLEPAVTENVIPGGRGRKKDHQTSLERYMQSSLAKVVCSVTSDVKLFFTQAAFHSLSCCHSLPFLPSLFSLLCSTFSSFFPSFLSNSSATESATSPLVFLLSPQPCMYI